MDRYASELRVEDVWALPIRGGPEDFPRVVKHLTSRKVLEAATPLIVKALFAVRWGLGAIMRLDRPPRTGNLVKDRLPAHLRETVSGFDADLDPFVPLYLLDDEFALETSNRTVHGIMHLGWVPDGSGRWQAQLAILVKPKGGLGDAYMRAIGPFRHRIVYPAILGRLGSSWEKAQHPSGSN